MNTLIYIFGPSTAGKSTTAELLRETLDNAIIVDFDVIKRQIPSYDWQTHATIGRDMTLATLGEELGSNTTIILLMPSSKDELEYNRILTIAREHTYQLINIELTAPDNVLIDRYKWRLRNPDTAKKDWKFKTLDEFRAKLRESYYRPKGTVTFDSSEVTPKSIVNAVLNLLQS